MSKLKHLIIYSFILFSFLSCGTNNMVEYRLSRLNKETMKQNEFIDGFFNCLNNGTSSDLMNLFSENAKKETDSLKEKADYFIEEFNDKFIYEQLGSYSENDTQLGYKIFSSHYKIVLNEEEYWLRVLTCFEDSVDEKNIGINQILFCKFKNRRDFEEKIYYEYSRDVSGIFVEDVTE